MSSVQTVQILLGSRCYLVPRDQLVAQSGFFQALFRSGMRESTDEVVTLHGLTHEGLEGVLRHITGGPVQPCSPVEEKKCGPKALTDECPSGQDEPSFVQEALSQGPMQALVEAACYLQVQGLLSFLQSSLSEDTCLDLLDVSQLHGQWDLAEACLRYMAVHYHCMLQRVDFQESPQSLKEHVLQERLRGVPALLLLSQQSDDSWVLLRYLEVGNGWQVMPSDVPQSMLRVQGYGAASLNNYLFVAGGTRENGQEVSAVHSYNPSTGFWTEEPAMNQKRYNFRLLAVGGSLYAVGGQSLQTMETFNPAQNTWNLAAPLPDPLVEFSACESLGKIYVVGGYTPRGRNLKVLRYCPAADQWTEVDIWRHHIRKQQMVSIEETLYSVGGFIRDGQSGQSEDSLSIHSYDTRTKEFTCLKVNTSKSGLSICCTLHNDGIYILSRDVNHGTLGKHRVFLKYCVFSEVCEYVRGAPSEGHNMHLFSVYLS
ncbi:PREDICTED: kelch-like protein 42 [Nanorana parkeri]|uniref:kelch-like protein 42 n=1 Tax=Nanorana parkeri TaxID=125878 RepID=UPI00085505C3|nr:PREDICTED: kelch-like protein 42 [Nanorana parkeri]